MSDEFDRQAEALLPCVCDKVIVAEFGHVCEPCKHRLVVATALRDIVTGYESELAARAELVATLRQQLAEAQDATAALICSLDSHTLGCLCDCVVCKRRAKWLAANREGK